MCARALIPHSLHQPGQVPGSQRYPQRQLSPRNPDLSLLESSIKWLEMVRVELILLSRLSLETEQTLFSVCTASDQDQGALNQVSLPPCPPLSCHQDDLTSGTHIYAGCPMCPSLTCHSAIIHQVPELGTGLSTQDMTQKTPASLLGLVHQLHRASDRNMHPCVYPRKRAHSLPCWTEPGGFLVEEYFS